MLLFAAWASFYTRVHSITLVGPVQYQLVLKTFLLTASAVLPVVLLIFVFLGLYNIRGARKLSWQLGRILVGVSLGLFLVMVLFFFNNQLFPSRFIILAGWAYGILLVFLGRVLLQMIQQTLFRYGKGLHYVVIINGTNTDSQIIQDSLKNPKWGLKAIRELSFGPHVLTELEELYASLRLDEIIQANPTLTDAENLQLLEFARSKGLAYSYVPNVFDVQRNVREVFDYNGVPLISIRNTPLDGWGKVAKRAMDIVVSAVAMLVLSPVYLILYVAVKLDSDGPAIYPYPRGGMGKDFTFYKFRSMYTHLSNGLGGEEAEKVREELWKHNDRGGAESPFLKIKNDPRITRVGKIIRKTKLDEIPQFWNVLRGDMSLVGPRAHMVDEVERYRNKYRRMFSIKPGIFGVSQIAQMSWPDLPFEEEIRLNTYYIENWSLWLDIKTLYKSAYLIALGTKPKEDY
jgi:exopolysaccharide biosynthesis polyprenyl glycosylphosphotransferase